jgi:hypothetical protein
MKILRRVITANIGHTESPEHENVFDVSQSLLSSEIVGEVLHSIPEHIGTMLVRRIKIEDDDVRELVDKHTLTAFKLVCTPNLQSMSTSFCIGIA